MTRNLSWARLVLCLAAVGACLAPSRVLGDELQYLTDNPQMIVSLDIATARKTKTWEEMLKLVKKELGTSDPFLSKIIESDLRVTWCLAESGGKRSRLEMTVMVFTAQKPVTLASLWAWFAPVVKENPQELPRFRETRYGGTTIYHDGTSLPFFIDGKFVVMAFTEFGKDKLSTLKKIIDRKKPAAMSAPLKAAFAEADFNNAFSLALDIKGLDPRNQAALVGIFEKSAMFGDIKANAGKVNGLAVKMNEGGKFKLKATLLCADKAAAGAVKDIGVRGLAEFKLKVAELTKMMLKEKGKDEDEARMLAAMAKALDELTIYWADSTVVAELALASSDAGLALLSLTSRVADTKPPKK